MREKREKRMRRARGEREEREGTDLTLPFWDIDFPLTKWRRCTKRVTYTERASYTISIYRPAMYDIRHIMYVYTHLNALLYIPVRFLLICRIFFSCYDIL